MLRRCGVSSIILNEDSDSVKEQGVSQQANSAQ